MPGAVEDPVTFTCSLPVRRETVWFLARLLQLRRIEVGTRRGRRSLGPFAQAVLVLRWFVDNARVRQLADDNRIGKSTAHVCLHEGIEVLAALAPDVHEALLALRARGDGHLNLVLQLTFEICHSGAVP